MARILVVDDDQDILRVAEKVLTTANYDVYTASDAVKAMDILQSSYFDAIISDANMPHYSGFELVQTIRGNKRFQKVAIAMLTGLRERRDIEKAIRVGVDEYIVKPIDPLLFLKKVESLFEKKPPQKRPEVHFNQPSSTTQAMISHKGQLLSLSESGLSFEFDHPLEQGGFIYFSCELFEKFRWPELKIKVISVYRGENQNWIVKGQFFGVNEKILQKIRNWVYQEYMKVA